MVLKSKHSHFLKIIKHILEHEHFCKIKQFSHHGTDRLKHCLRVSYYSYKIAKALNLDYKASAKAGLLHDFFYGEEDKTIIAYLAFQRKHPKIASENALRFFEISIKEQDMIETHMFPFTKPSKYLEGWIISFVDKAVGSYEYTVHFTKKKILKK